MPSLSTVMALWAARFSVIEDQAAPTISCMIEQRETYSAPDWDSLVFYATNYQLCGCGYH